MAANEISVAYNTDLGPQLELLLSNLERATAQSNDNVGNARHGREAAELVRHAIDDLAEGDALRRILRQAATHLHAMEHAASADTNDRFENARRAMTACFWEITVRDDA